MNTIKSLVFAIFWWFSAKGQGFVVYLFREFLHFWSCFVWCLYVFCFCCVVFVLLFWLCLICLFDLFFVFSFNLFLDFGVLGGVSTVNIHWTPLFGCSHSSWHGSMQTLSMCLIFFVSHHHSPIICIKQLLRGPRDMKSWKDSPKMMTIWLVVEPTPLKNISQIKLDHLHRVRGENSKNLWVATTQQFSDLVLNHFFWGGRGPIIHRLPSHWLGFSPTGEGWRGFLVWSLPRKTKPETNPVLHQICSEPQTHGNKFLSQDSGIICLHGNMPHSGVNFVPSSPPLSRLFSQTLAALQVSMWRFAPPFCLLLFQTDHFT